nr:TonB-dependent receptor plug domain-containing protein [Chitinophagaceae bacterium]
MNKIFIHIALFLLVASSLKATNLILHVQDKSSNKAIGNASVQYFVSGNASSKIANSEGVLILSNIHFPLRISCTALGYEAIKVSIAEKDVKQQANDFLFEIKMEKSAVLMHDVVVTAQNTPVLATQSVYKVNTISAAQIGQRGAVSLNDVLNYEMNNFVSNDNILGSSLSIGGIGGQNVKILLNGIPVTGRENGNIDLGQINMNNVKRIETIQGPMSVIYGSNALGGVINVITNQSNKKLTGTLKSYFESIGRYNLSGNISVSKKRHSLQT